MKQVLLRCFAAKCAAADRTPDLQSAFLLSALPAAASHLAAVCGRGEVTESARAHSYILS